MPPNSPVGQATVEEGSVKAAADHRLRAEAVALAQDNP